MKKIRDLHRGTLRHRISTLPLGTQAHLPRSPLASVCVPTLLRDSTRRRSAPKQLDELLDEQSLLYHRIAVLEQALTEARGLADHDPVTGVPNRRLLEDRFKQARAVSSRQRQPMAVLFLDIDGFKRINDAYGHVVGDCLLHLTAMRLVHCVRASDTVCRYGGDEFVVLLPASDGRLGGVSATRKIRERLAAPYVVGGASMEVPASVGMALYPGDGTELGRLIERADSAMYREKAGKHAEQTPACSLRIPLTARNSR